MFPIPGLDNVMNGSNSGYSLSGDAKSGAAGGYIGATSFGNIGAAGHPPFPAFGGGSKNTVIVASVAAIAVVGLVWVLKK